MKKIKLLSAALSAAMVITAMPVRYAVYAQENSIKLAAELIYRESFEADTDFPFTQGYTAGEDAGESVLAVDRIGYVDNMRTPIGAEASDVIAEYDMKLTGANGATNNSIFLALRAGEGNTPSLRFAYHDISKYDTESGTFNGERQRDRLSVGYSSGSDDMTKWNIGAMSGTIGIENTSARSFGDYYTFRAAAVGNMAYHQIIAADGTQIEAVSADLSEFDVPKQGRALIGAHNCAANIREIRMYNAVSATQISVEADNMELSAGETADFNLRVRDDEGVWHSLDKSRNTEFEFDYDDEKLAVDADNGIITALADDGLVLKITARDFYSGETLCSEFEFEKMSDEQAVSEACDVLRLDISETDSDFELPQRGIFDTKISWSSSSAAIRISGAAAKVIAQDKDTEVVLSATVSRNGASQQKQFHVTVKASPLAPRDIILKGERVFCEDFDDEDAIDSELKSVIDGSRIAWEDGALHINSSGAVMQLCEFGPDMRACITEYDVRQLSCNANSTAQFSMGLMRSGSVSHRFAYADVSAYNSATNALDGVTSRDRLILGQTSGSDNIGNWTLFGAGKSPIGILNTSSRSFDKYYTFSAAAAGSTMHFSVKDGDTILDSISNFSPGLRFSGGRMHFNMQSTELLLDNISVYEAVGFQSMRIVPEKSAVKPDTPVHFDIILPDGSVLDRKYYDMLDFECSDGIAVDTKDATLCASAEGDFIVRVTAHDYSDSKLCTTAAAAVSASVGAELIEEIADSVKIEDYIEYPLEVTGGFTLPSEISGAAAVWSADDSAVTFDGGRAEVLRSDADKEVSLSVLITLGGISVSRSFKIKILRNFSNEEMIELDRGAITLPARTKTDLTLTQKGRYGTLIEWSSDNAAVISADGRVKRQPNDTSVRLCALFSAGDLSRTVYYNVVVEGTGSIGGGGSSGGTGSYGGGSPSKGSNISAAVDNRAVSFRFSDVAEDFWAREQIYELAEAGVVAKAEQFRPNDYITREEFVKLVVEAFGLYSVSAECDFDDVKAGDWYYGYAASGVRAGIISGMSEREFGVGRLITRQDIAVIIARIPSLGISAASECGFDDYNEISDYAKDAVAYLCGCGVISGMGDNRFEPKANATRAQAAVIINLARKK